MLVVFRGVVLDRILVLVTGVEVVRIVELIRSVDATIEENEIFNN